MKRLVAVFAVSFFAVWLVASCSNQKMSPVSVNPAGGSGVAAITIDLGAVGLAKQAKAATINLDSMTFDLTATGETPIHRVFPLSGHGQQIVNSTFSFDPRQWSLLVKTYATHLVVNYSCPMCGNFLQTRVVHQGSTSFTVTAGDTAKVNMAVSSQYSMLLVWVNPIPDSCNDVTLYSGDSLNAANSMTELCDSSFSVGSMGPSDTIKLHDDYLNVQMQKQSVQAIIRGTYGAPGIPLYWGALEIPQVIAGQDTTYSFNLNWIGPGGVPQVKTITVTVGKIGLITAIGTPVPKPN